MTYREYLNTDHWKLIRDQRREMDGHKCFICRSSRDLNVHHLTYKTIGHENVETDVVTLCHGCHATLHRIQELTKDLIKGTVEEPNRGFQRRIMTLLVNEIWLRDIGNGGDVKVFDTGMSMVTRLAKVLEFIHPETKTMRIVEPIRESLVYIRHAKICELYMRGGSLCSIADQMNMKDTNVQKVLKAHGLNCMGKIK